MFNYFFTILVPRKQYTGERRQPNPQKTLKQGMGRDLQMVGVLSPLTKVKNQWDAGTKELVWARA